MASIGIDLGTTNSVLSRISGGKPQTVAISGAAIVPSVVLFDGNRVLVGSEARNLELLQPERTVRSVKRHMGTAHRFPVGDRLLSPEEVSAEILKALKRGAEQTLGEPVSDVVITVPAYFDDAQRRATLRAGELAGLNVLRLLNEPTSAALCYERLGVGENAEEELILVYDLGGGTFDVSVLEVFQGVREVRATTGNSRLGGDDFDDKLVTLFLDKLKTSHQLDLREDLRAMARLRRLAEATKIQLSADVRVSVREDFIAAQDGRSTHLELEVTRREFEQLISDFVESTVELSRSALSAAGLKPEELSRICLVGGSTRIPLVRARLEEEFGVAVHEEIDPDLAVGLGASIQAAMLKGEELGRVLVDVAAHTLGIRVVGEEDDGRGPPDTFAPVLRRNTVLPAVRVEEFYTLQDRQAKLVVDVFQGEMPNVSLNTPVGSFECELEPAPVNSPIRIAFNYNLNGVVRVTVSQPGFASAERMVELSVPDASRKEQGTSAPLSAVERRAVALLASLDGPPKQRLDALLDTFRKAVPSEREPAEDALLDFFLDHDHAHDHAHDHDSVEEL